MRVLHKDMQELLVQSRAAAVTFVPEKADVPRLRFAPQIHNFELTILPVVVPVLSGVPAAGALTFSLSSVSSYIPYATIFDQYRVLQVIVKIVPNNYTGSIYTAIDYDDANVPASTATLLGYDSLSISTKAAISTRFLTPHVSSAVFSGAAFTSYALAPSRQWIDCASPSTAYYGLKYTSDNFTANGTLTFISTLMIQFQGQRAT
jgi:hypothetical protein